jgi:hypothetical protein
VKWCTGCHSSWLPDGERAGAPIGVDFNSLNGIETPLQRIYARSADGNTTMPPIAAITDEERTRVGDWITCGAPGLTEAVFAEVTEPRRARSRARRTSAHSPSSNKHAELPTGTPP